MLHVEFLSSMIFFESKFIKEYGNLRCLKVVLRLHNAPYILERPPLLDVQLGDCRTMLIPRLRHHLFSALPRKELKTMTWGVEEGEEEKGVLVSNVC